VDGFPPLILFPGEVVPAFVLGFLQDLVGLVDEIPFLIEKFLFGHSCPRFAEWPGMPV
jgi:hypothetical protein